jgi:hypothetical protein
MAKKKRSSIDDIADLTALNIGSTVGVSTLYSLPETPQVPLMNQAKGFAGSTMSLLPTLKGASALLRSVEGLEKTGKKRKR